MLALYVVPSSDARAGTADLPVRQVRWLAINGGADVVVLPQPDPFSDHDALVAGSGRLQLVANILGPHVAVEANVQSALMLYNILTLGVRGYLLPTWISPYAAARGGLAVLGLKDGPDGGASRIGAGGAFTGGAELTTRGGFNAAVEAGGMWSSHEWKGGYGRWVVQVSLAMGYRF